MNQSGKLVIRLQDTCAEGKFKDETKLMEESTTTATNAEGSIIKGVRKSARLLSQGKTTLDDNVEELKSNGQNKHPEVDKLPKRVTRSNRKSDDIQLSSVNHDSSDEQDGLIRKFVIIFILKIHFLIFRY